LYYKVIGIIKPKTGKSIAIAIEAGGREKETRLFGGFPIKTSGLYAPGGALLLGG
jgi:hypothetical protein